MINRPLEPITEPEIWKRYKDTNIFVSDQGRAKKVCKNGNEYEVGWMEKSPKKTNRQVRVKIGRKDLYLKAMVWETFKGKIPPDCCLAHKNGAKLDNSIYNLYLTTKRDLGLKTGYKSHSQRVVCLDNRKIYKSAKDCARDLDCMHMTIINACNGKVKNPLFNVYWYDAENQKYYRGKYRKENLN